MQEARLAVVAVRSVHPGSMPLRLCKPQASSRRFETPHGVADDAWARVTPLPVPERMAPEPPLPAHDVGFDNVAHHQSGPSLLTRACGCAADALLALRLSLRWLLAPVCQGKTCQRLLSPGRMPLLRRRPRRWHSLPWTPCSARPQRSASSFAS